MGFLIRNRKAEYNNKLETEKQGKRKVNRIKKRRKQTLSSKNRRQDEESLSKVSSDSSSVFSFFLPWSCFYLTFLLLSQFLLSGAHLNSHFLQLSGFTAHTFDRSLLIPYHLSFP